MTKSPNHQYNLPERGATDWDVSLNDNFEQIDSDVEIRDVEANKGEYTPKEGAKFEATDSGAVYYGNGTSWVLADRRVNDFEAKSLSAGELLKAGQSSTAVVAPSIDGAFDTATGAVEDGFDDIIIAERISEDNIPVIRNNMRFRGWGQGSFTFIDDPQNGNPIFTTQGSHARDVTISNFRINGGADSGPVIDAWPADNVGASLWEIYNCHFRAGPILLKGPRNQLRHVTVDNESTDEYPKGGIGKSGYKTKAALVQNGLTFGIMGGSYSNKNEGMEAAYLSCGGATITGGVSFCNAGDEFPGDKREILWSGCNTVTVGPCSFESSKKYTMQFGNLHNGVKMQGVSGVTFMGTKIGNIRVEGSNSGNISFYNPSGQPHFDLESRADILVYKGSDTSVTATRVAGGAPVGNDITVVGAQGSDNQAYCIGGGRDAPSTQFQLQIHTSEPEYPAEAGMVIADGGNWDPLSTGNAALVTWDTNSQWSPIFEYSGPL